MRKAVEVDCNSYEEFVDIFNTNNNIFIANITKLERRNKILALAIALCLYGNYKLANKTKAQKLRMEVLEARINILSLEAGKETNECNA